MYLSSNHELRFYEQSQQLMIPIKKYMSKNYDYDNSAGEAMATWHPICVRLWFKLN